MRTESPTKKAPARPLESRQAPSSLLPSVFRLLPLFAALLPLNAFGADDVDLSKLPPPAQVEVDFDRDIRPILDRSCIRCHGREKPKSDFRLDTRELALKGGEYGVDVVPGDSAKSRLIHVVAKVDPEFDMPPEGKGDPLTRDEIGLLRAWIDQGVVWSSRPSQAQEMRFSITPMVRVIRVAGDERRFREHWWAQDGWNAGVDEFSLVQPHGKDGVVTLDGRVIGGGHEYRIGLDIRSPDVGFTRFGFEQYRRWYDDSGGYYAPFATNQFALDRDLHVDIGRFWAEAGLTLPHWPRMVLGYEYQFKEGSKSLLGWSDVTPDFTPLFPEFRAIYPTAKEIDEQNHILKFDISHEIQGVYIEDNFRAEFYDLRTRRVERGAFDLGSPPADFATRFSETHEHFQAANAIRAEKQLLDWLFVSGGYLYSDLDGDATFNLEAFMPSDPLTVMFAGERSDRILLERRSHVFNANTQLGPWQDLTFVGGVQSEWTREKGLTDALVPGFPDPDPKFISSNRDKAVVEESFDARYVGLPYTVIFAGARFQQERIDHFEQSFVDDAFDDSQDFVRDTDASSDLQEYRMGFTVSPCPQASIYAAFKHRLKDSDYDHGVDFDGSATPGNGYAAFIRSRDIESDNLEVKLSLRPAPRVRVALKYELVATDYRTATDPSEALFFDPITFVSVSVVQPGGGIFAGNYDAHIFSLNGTFTPWRRFLLSSTVSYSDARTASGVANGTTLLPYEGDVYSALATATYLLDPRTDLHASYSFSRADFDQEDTGANLPLGIAYSRHGLLAGLTRRLKENITATVQYGYFHYDEPTSGGLNNYTAHAVLGTLAIVIK